MELQEARPPYVTFEVRAVEDRAASIEAGHYVAVDQHFALITPMGSKDRIERKVLEWFASLQQSVEEGRFPAAWLANFKAQYEAWKQGTEVPLTGKPVVNWPAASPAQVKALLAVGCRTVEDLAAANEEVIHRLGMGGRALRSLAVEWLEEAGSVGKVAEEVNSLKIRNQELQAQNDSLLQRLEALEKAASKKL